MHEFIKYLIKKSDIRKNEYYAYNHKKEKKTVSENKLNYNKILEPKINSYVVFDFETTGLSPKNDMIVEIGAIKVDNGIIIGSFNELINPQRAIPPFISQKINITNEMVKDKRKIDTVLPEFIEFIEDYPLMAHNAKFDMSFLMENSLKFGFKPQNSVLDTLYLSRKYLKDAERHSLTYLTQFFGIEHKNAHRAYADALALYEIYKIIREKYFNLHTDIHLED